MYWNQDLQLVLSLWLVYVHSLLNHLLKPEDDYGSQHNNSDDDVDSGNDDSDDDGSDNSGDDDDDDSDNDVD